MELAAADALEGATLDTTEDLYCPITHELFEDPCVLEGDGRTYERRAIEEWLRRGNRTARSRRGRSRARVLRTSNRARRYGCAGGRVLDFDCRAVDRFAQLVLHEEREVRDAARAAASMHQACSCRAQHDLLSILGLRPRRRRAAAPTCNRCVPTLCERCRFEGTCQKRQMRLSRKRCTPYNAQTGAPQVR